VPQVAKLKAISGVHRDPMAATASSEELISGAAALVRPGGRDSATIRFEREVVSFFVDVAEMLGVPKSVAAIYGICFATGAPLSFADISARLYISQGSISQGLRVLREMGALNVVGTHDRRDYFAPEFELRKLGTRFIEERLEAQLNMARERLRSMDDCIPTKEAASDAQLCARLKYLHSWHEKSRALVPILKAFLKLG